METHTFTITITTAASREAILEDVTDLLTGAADGYVGDPDRALGGAEVAVSS